jgi:hypothetical protein
MKFYIKNIEIEKNEVLNKAREEEIFVSFDNGKTKVSIYQNVYALSRLLREEIIEFSYLPWDETWLFNTIIKSYNEVTDEVLNHLADIAHQRKIKLDYDYALLLVNHPSAMKWLLKRGAKCKYIYGKGETTMEHFMRKKSKNDLYADEMISLLKEYKAIDYAYLKSNIKGNTNRSLWSKDVLSCFYDIIIYYDNKELRFDGNSITKLSLDKEIYISYDNGKTKLSLNNDVKAIGKAFKEGVIKFDINSDEPDYLLTSILKSSNKICPHVLDVLVREANKAGIKIKQEILEMKK